MEPYLDGLQDSLDRRFQHLGVLGAFSVLKPGAASEEDESNVAKLSLLSKQFLRESEATVLQEWTSYRQHVLLGAFQVSQQPHNLL